MIRPFDTPLVEVAFEMQLRPGDVIEFRARTFHGHISNEFPQFERLPLFLVPPENNPVPIPPSPAYRFQSNDGQRMVQLGPRILAVNMLRWEGYPAYRALVEKVVGVFVDVTPDCKPDRVSVAFINRIPAQSIEEMRAILAAPLPERPGITFPEFVSQFACNNELGSILTQIATMPPDERTHSPYINLSHIFRRSVDETVRIDEMLNWLDAAHEQARELMLASLTPDARRSWDESYAARQQH